ncbi:protein ACCUMULATION AND REPLICATION OF CHLOROPLASTS 3, chloroplastic isoform X1 [Magnolia sinica]|uniref:protein ACCUMULATION AND REPLICATION OF CHLOROPLASTS 3, chloroplastic isoform X1 n=2 Tax=Magnolia sinica TaxID=86752 RepID=UPI00265A01BF|nr:protein ACCUMULATION AND REPLICATION OF CHLOROPLASTS 3, chloroplastic isoform X1 [Magnolia sinica]XP_058090472.1 protein ACCUMULATION AND REPLICATION OF CHLOROPLASTS 3, chloroplastic isoform X1 [Magnolia sinica]
MELHLSTRFLTFSSPTSCGSSPNFAFLCDFSRTRFPRGKSRRIATPLRTSSTSNGHTDRESRSACEDLWRDSDSVEVIGIGSRKDAVLDFCLESSFESTSMRFWTVHMRDSQKVQLLQRSLGKDTVLRNVEGLLSAQSYPRATILVASAGYSVDHVTALELLSVVKSAGGLAIAIVLKPFSFEGQRRQHEVENLVNKLWEGTNFCIVVDTDALLKKEVVTLAEASRTASNVVLLAINAISVLISDMHPKFLDAPHDKFKEVKLPEVLTLLGSYREAKVGFGAGFNIKSSIARAVFDCPFLSGGLKDLDGIVICNVASGIVMDKSDLQSFMHAFRQTTECTKDIIFSSIHEPNIEPNLIVTTLLVLGCNKQKVPPKKSFLSGLASRFPFLFSFLGRDQESKSNLSAQLVGDLCPQQVLNSSTGRDILDGSDENLDAYSEELETLSNNSYDEIYPSRTSDSRDKRTAVGDSVASPEPVSPLHLPPNEGEHAFQREPLNNWNIGPGFRIAEKWAKERAAAFGATANIDKSNVYTLPVGVKPSEQTTDGPQSSSPQPAEMKMLNDMEGEPLGSPNVPPQDLLTDMGFETVMDIYDAASTVLKGKHADLSRKQGLLSVRAASMLEAERDPQKKWSPIMEMQYRGGIYRGRCQGGLPEGKGRLTLTGGSFYDGMWRYGKRSGLGTFYYSNGDVFQGSWRDDLMHGKGWLYFHTGDRWFANFWKGKANGEGRFYSKLGKIFFGNFQDGWRHGHSLCIDIDGTRWAEIWDEGVLVSRSKLDAETETK